MTVVIDASAIVSLLTDDDEAIRVRRALSGHEDLPWTLPLADAEVGQALRGLERRRVISPELAEAALRSLSKLRIVRTGLVDHVDVAWSLRHKLSFYDALYVALAARIDAPLVTLDARIATVRGLPAEIIVA